MSNIQHQPGSQNPGDHRWMPESILLVGWQRKGWVVCGLLAGLLISAGVVAVLPSVYQSSAQISIVKKLPVAVTGVDTRQMAAEENASPPQDLLKSSLIIDRAIQSKGLNTLPMLAAEEKDLTDKIRTALTVVPSKGSSGQTFVFKLHYRGQDADDCRTVLSALLESYREYMDKKHQTGSEDTIELIMRDKQNLEKDIAEKETAYRAFRESAPLLGKGKDGLELRQERLNTIQAKRSVLLLQRVEFEGQLAALEAAQKEGRKPEVVLAMLVDFTRKNETDAGRDVKSNMQDQLFPMLMEERKIIQVHGANHPEVAEIRNRIEIARRLLLLPPSAWKSESAEGIKGVQDPIPLHVQLLKQKLQHNKISEGLLMQIFQSEQDEARRLSSYEIQNDSYRSRLAMSQQMYEALVKRLNEVNLARNVGGYQIETIEPPSLGKRVAPILSVALIAGALLGVGLGFGLALWAESRAVQLHASREVNETANGVV